MSMLSTGFAANSSGPTAADIGLKGQRSDERKSYFAGTHRVRTPAQTLAAIQPALRQVGVTRLADVTGLDDIGIPVYQAIRPGSWSLSVSQGKGLDPVAATVSAAMESIEMWHAERLPPGQRLGTLREVGAELDYDVFDLPMPVRSHLNSATVLEWTAAYRLTDGRSTWLPSELLRLDGRCRDRWTLRAFNNTSNGLASGNTVTEAVLHGLYELVERDARADNEAADNSAASIVEGIDDGPAAALVERMARARVELRVWFLPNRADLPCFAAYVWSESAPIAFGGYGCHLDADVALCRALTEAAQSRLTWIAGTRDDMTRKHYRHARKVAWQATDASAFGAMTRPADRIRHRDVAVVRNADLAADLETTLARVGSGVGEVPLVADHTRDDVSVPVVHVICPRLRIGRIHE
jgi:ribosomal protein S12 methylthiotransferase accessory factor